MVLLITTSPILAAFEALPASSRHDLDLPDSLSLQDPISHAQLIALARYFRSSSNSNETHSARSLNSLLRGTKVYIPPPPKKPEPTPEYLALKARLLAAAETDAYNRMITSAPSLLNPHNTSTANPIFTSSTPTVSALHDPHNHTDEKDTSYPDPLTPSLVLNIFLSVLITGFSVYFALRSFRTPEVLIETVAGVWRGRTADRGGRGGEGVSEAVKVLLSLGVAVGVGVAEVVIYAIYLGKVDEARRVERRVREKKVVVGSEGVGGGRTVGGNGMDGEKEEIWGRGPNGGLRRRLRERWEDKEKEMEKEREE
ncbi:hypothetical protein BO70DRAFT_329172 [Aspergillus heteromorphus CBS 117.55]|uniref:Endoplasmic reticulum-based factor for assembly of V-ATPase n=1 Tax=Aspergillus heteromorphus CBS 117.55 TaxID=1448321 RepID=A0A317X0B7_9EURO|nr:uncharacterized protein BO70DRAFT_329172 [Aspergillus heteromorphus CBS 117.55]PWY91007.1 hypothetical protein BO70DRAFT_329172 [Aspergillus heteromorphus CBS 117.55]